MAALPVTMPAVVKIDSQRRIVCSTFYGSVTADDLLRHQELVQAAPEFQRTFVDLVDFSDVAGALVDGQVIQLLASRQSLFAPEAHHVIIAPADMAHDLALQYRERAIQTRPNLYIVRSMEEAHGLLRKLGYEI